MAQKLLGMTFLFGCTMTLSYGYDNNQKTFDKMIMIMYYLDEFNY